MAEPHLQLAACRRNLDAARIDVGLLDIRTAKTTGTPSDLDFFAADICHCCEFITDWIAAVILRLC